jgi:hypothetical protein
MSETLAAERWAALEALTTTPASTMMISTATSNSTKVNPRSWFGAGLRDRDFMGSGFSRIGSPSLGGCLGWAFDSTGKFRLRGRGSE